MTPRSPVLRRVLAGAVLVCAAALVTACGTQGSPSAAPTVTKTVTVPASPAPDTSASATASPGPRPCPTSGLHVHLGTTQGAAGSIYTVIDFTNASASTCTLYGFPGVSFVTSDVGGHVVGAPAGRTRPPAARLVTLAPGSTASSVLRITDAGIYPPSRCKVVSVHWLQIYPPNQTAQLYLAFNSTTCSRPIVIMHVNVVVAGTGGPA